MDKPSLELADILREFGEDYRHQQAATLSPQQRRAMRAIEICRTAALGGHIDECDACGHQVISYNSCCNRHCPKCQSLAKARWLQARQAELLPVEYYHVIFTLPDDLLAPLTLQNQRILYNLLFRAASQTLLEVAADPKHLGAQIGFTAVLHTWGQKLNHHPHLHCVVPGGGLSHDGRTWISCPPRFFLNVRVLSSRYREHFLQALEKAFHTGELEMHGKIQYLSHPQAFAQLLVTCRQTDWVVYSQPPFGGPQKVLDYLGRYTHRIALSNQRLVSLEGGRVSFTWKDYSQGNVERIMTLPAHEFIRRFLLHVLPDGFVRIRHFGFLANLHRAAKLRLCRQHLKVSQEPTGPKHDPKDWVQLLQSLTGKDPFVCPNCQHGRLVRIRDLPPILIPPHTVRAPP
jgi:hypothetical protein